MIMAEDKDKTLGYKPEIKYTEEYDSKYVEQYDSNNISDIVVNNNINETIDNTMDEVASLVSMLPDRIHIAVNGERAGRFENPSSQYAVRLD